MEYSSVVLELLEKGKYPVLEGHVLLDVYYKMIPSDYVSESSQSYDRRVINPEDVYIRDADPFCINYLTPFGNQLFHMHRTKTLTVESFPLQCIRVKLVRSFVDSTILNRPSASFEKEIYHLLTLLNTNVPRVASLINLNFLDSTRFLPQRVTLWVFKYTERNVEQKPFTTQLLSRFGPPSHHEYLPVRVVSGRLAECTSRSVLLSLNNHVPNLDYTDHYSQQWKTTVPLAFNPLENPIVTL